MDQELVDLLQSGDANDTARGAEMLSSFLFRASFPGKSVQALKEVLRLLPLRPTPLLGVMQGETARPRVLLYCYARRRPCMLLGVERGYSHMARLPSLATFGR
jgi:hypothetical protein